MQVINFKQGEEEGIDQAWNRFQRASWTRTKTQISRWCTFAYIFLCLTP
jgi:hypothetical protein